MCLHLLRGILLLAVAGSMPSLAGCGWRSEEPQEPPPPTMTTATPLRKQIVEWDAYTGRLEAVEFVEIRARVSGYLESIHFDEGQMVEEGDLLFVIDPRPFEAELTGAQATLNQAKSQLRQAEARLKEAESGLLQTEAQLNLADARLKRVTRLAQSNATTQEDLDERQAEFLQAEADVEASKAAVGSANAAIATAEAAIASAEAGVDAAELRLEFTQVTAPVAGRISRESVTVGNLVSGGTANTTLLTTIASADPIYCTFDANEQEVLKYVRLALSGKRESSRVAKNPVYMGLVDEEGFPHQGHMDFVDNRFDPGTATLRARCIFRNENQLLVPGMFARIRIPGSASYPAILIPDSAIATDQSSQFVYIVEDGLAQRRDVVLGPMVDGLRVVREGLEGDEALVTQGLLQARPKLPVQTKPGVIEAVEDGLPDEYTPLPPEEWIGESRRPSTDAE